MQLHRLQPFSNVTMSLTASLLSGYNKIGERRIKEKCKEQRIGKIKSIGRHTVRKFTSYITFGSKAESRRTTSFGEHSLPVLLPSYKQRNAPLLQKPLKYGKLLLGQVYENRKKQFWPSLWLNQYEHGFKKSGTGLAMLLKANYKIPNIFDNQTLRNGWWNPLLPPVTHRHVSSTPPP